MKIDIYSHILTEKYIKYYSQKSPKAANSVEFRNRAVIDLNMRLPLMDRFPDILQVLTIANPPLDVFVSPDDAAELARIANDEMAELLVKYPNKFVAAVACVPMNNIEAALKETDRAITQLGFKGIQIGTRVHGEPLDLPQFKPLYEKMAQYNLPIWIHPVTYDKLDPDTGVFSWPFETATAMYHLVTSGIFYTFPNIKFITHHCGSMAPYFANRIKWTMSAARKDRIGQDADEHFRKFYNDTAVYGNTEALMCGYAYFGADHILFGTDAPLGGKYGITYETVTSIERMNIPEAEKEKIFIKNAENLLRLAI
jgi:predicted TIM-barrel fold metal-dependent hydrolase